MTMVAVSVPSAIQSWDMGCQDAFSDWDADAVIAAGTRAAHAISMASLLFPPTDHAG